MKLNQEPCTKLKKVIDKGKRSKTLSEVKPVENINKSRAKGSPSFMKNASFSQNFFLFPYRCFRSPSVTLVFDAPHTGINLTSAAFGLAIKHVYMRFRKKFVICSHGLPFFVIIYSVVVGR